MPSLSCRTALVAGFLLASFSMAQAHITFEKTEAEAKSTFKGVLRVGHGCEGSPTTKITVSIPEGAIVAKPMPKPGWSVSTTLGDYAKSYNYYGKEISTGVKSIVWSGNTLSDDHYDEFVFRVYLTDAFQPETSVAFPVVQTCEKGGHAWVEVPTADQDVESLKEPAPMLKIMASEANSSVTSYTVGALKIENSWSRATPAGADVAVGFLKITNTGSTPDVLTGASLDGASKGELHEMTSDNGVMKMRSLPQGIEIPAGQSIVLKPGDRHLMFTGLERGLTKGSTVQGTLTFQKAGTTSIGYRVGGIGEMGSGHVH